LTDTEHLYLNYYAPCTLHTRTPGGQDVCLRVDGSYPCSGNVTVTLEGLAEPENFTLCLRIPTWSAQTQVRVNGTEQAGATAGQYLPLTACWRNGDTVELSLSMTVHYWVGEDRYAKRTSVYYGPILLVVDTDHEYLPAHYIRLLPEDLEKLTVEDGSPYGTWLRCHARERDGETVCLIDFASGGKTHSHYTSWLDVRHSMLPMEKGRVQWMNRS
jgi:DUF1680 family protein